MSALAHKEDERNREHGFTMAELLIVVAIVAVLVAIAVPVFSAQLKNSRLAVDHAAMRDAYALVQLANNMQEVEVEGRTYSFDKLRNDYAGGASQLWTIYLAKDCDSFVFPSLVQPLYPPEGAYLFKESGCDDSNSHFCETCNLWNRGGMHYKDRGIMVFYNVSTNSLAFNW